MNKTKLGQIKQFFQNKPVIAVYLYGSAVEGKLKTLSDIDIGVLLTDDVLRQEYLDKRLKYISELTKFLGPKKADVVILNEAPPLLAHQIITTGQAVYIADQFRKTRFEVETLKKYDDARFLRRVYYSYLEKRIKENKIGEKYEK